MSWKPCRGSGLSFEKAINREQKYREMLNGYLHHPVGIMEYSKTYYHWLVAERDCQQSFSGKREDLKNLYGTLLPTTTLQSFERHRDLCYAPLRKIMSY